MQLLWKIQYLKHIKKIFMKLAEFDCLGEAKRDINVISKGVYLMPLSIIKNIKDFIGNIFN
jgi:hypothetical protein